MKVAVFVSYLPPHVGGLEVVAESQIKALAAAGQQVTVVTSACAARPGTEHLGGYTVHRISAWNYFEDKMHAVFPIFSPMLFFHAFRAVKNADIVHAHDAFYLTSLAAAFWTRVLRKPLILTQHVDMVPHPKAVVNLAQKLVYATSGKFILHSSNKIIVLNTRVRDFLIGRGIDASKIVFLPNGVDTKAFAPATAEERRALRKQYHVPQSATLALFVGRFAPKKGFTKLIELAPINNLHLVFAGGHAPEGHSRADHHFLGPVSRHDMPGVFKMCDLFVLPSEGEGFPVTVQEAMATGLPVITTDDPAYEPYQLDRTHMALIKPTVQNLTAAFEQLVADQKKRERMSAYARAYAQAHFAWPTNVKHLTNLYSEGAL